MIVAKDRCELSQKKSPNGARQRNISFYRFYDLSSIYMMHVQSIRSVEIAHMRKGHDIRSV